MGATYTLAAATTNYADAASQSKYGTNTTLAMRFRFKGDVFFGLPNYNTHYILNFADRGNLKIAVNRDDNFRIAYSTTADGFVIDSANFITPASLDANAWYVLRYVFNGTTQAWSLWNDTTPGSETLVKSGGFAFSGAVPNAGSGNGVIRIGNDGSTARSWTLDALALYTSTSLTVAAPTTGDSNIIGLYKFDEGTGTSVADATGGTSLTIAGSGTWNTADGAWDGSASTFFRPYFITG